MVGEAVRLSDERVAEMRENPEDVYDMIQEGDDPQLDIGAAWDAIRYLLRKIHPDDPLSEFWVKGGISVGDDLGYGPGMAYLSSEVLKIASLLAKTTAEDLRDAFNPVEMMRERIYPGIWDRDPKVDDTIGYVVEQFEKLKSFVVDASTQRQSFVLWVS